MSNSRQKEKKMKTERKRVRVSEHNNGRLTHSGIVICTGKTFPRGACLLHSPFVRTVRFLRCAVVTTGVHYISGLPSPPPFPRFYAVDISLFQHPYAGVVSAGFRSSLLFNRGHTIPRPVCAILSYLTRVFRRILAETISSSPTYIRRRQNKFQGLGRYRTTKGGRLPKVRMSKSNAYSESETIELSSRGLYRISRLRAGIVHSQTRRLSSSRKSLKTKVEGLEISEESQEPQTATGSASMSVALSPPMGSAHSELRLSDSDSDNSNNGIRTRGLANWRSGAWSYSVPSRGSFRA